MDFVKAELDVEGSFGSEGNLILQSRIQNKHINSLYKKYLMVYVKCNDCKGLDTELTKDQSTRLQNLECKTCNATRTVASIQKGYHAKKRGERRKERQK